MAHRCGISPQQGKCVQDVLLRNGDSSLAPGQICCTSKVETARSVTTTSCDIERRVGASCTSETTRKPVYRNETIAVPGRGFDEEDHTASAHHDPGAVSLCPPPHKMTRDGCQ